MVAASPDIDVVEVSGDRIGDLWWNLTQSSASFIGLLADRNRLDQIIQYLTDLSKAIASDVTMNSQDVVKSVNAYGSSHGKDAFEMFGDIWNLLSSATCDDGIKSNIVRLATRVAKVELNVLASGRAEYQSAVFQHERALRKMIYRVTGGLDLEDRAYQALGAALVKILYNLFTPPRFSNSDENGTSSSQRQPVSFVNERVEKALDAYLSGSREDNIFERLLWSPDMTTINVTFHLFIVMAQSDPSRWLSRIAKSPVGLEWIRRCLVRIDEAGPENETVRDTGIEYAMMYISSNLHSILNSAFKRSEQTSGSDGVLPSRIMLFKMIDRFHVLRKSSSPLLSTPCPSADIFLITEFNELAERAMTMVENVEGNVATLPSVFEAVVLVAEILTTIGEVVDLRAQEVRKGGKGRQAGKEGVDGEMDVDEEEEGQGSAKPGGDEEMLNRMREDGPRGIVKTIVVLLRAMIKFLPAEAPFTTSLTQNLPVQHPGGARITDLPAGLEVDTRAFSRMKSTLVTLLTVLVDGDEETAGIVFRERGVEEVLKMCQRDNRDEYLLEHATFALATLMKVHGPTRDLVREIQPTPAPPPVSGSS